MISYLERQTIRDGSAGANSLKTNYWKQPEHIFDPELQIAYLHDVIRSSGLEGNSPTMFEGIQQATAHIEKIRADRDLLNTWRPFKNGS